MNHMIQAFQASNITLADLVNLAEDDMIHPWPPLLLHLCLLLHVLCRYGAESFAVSHAAAILPTQSHKDDNADRKDRACRLHLKRSNRDRIHYDQQTASWTLEEGRES